MKNILVTGAAGFIGFHLCRRLCSDGWNVYGIDNLNDYYDVSLKEARLDVLKKESNFSFEKIDMADTESIASFFASNELDAVVNLAAQPGVRYSLKNPGAYIQSNVVGFANVLEGCRHNGIEHLVFASSSSIYGANKTQPYSVHHNVDHPVSLYAATKKSNELMAHSYSHLYGLPCTGLRFFTVYGPWGRPDMAYFLFVRAILNGSPIQVFNHGRMARDFTYIGDIVEGVTRVIPKPAASDPDWSGTDPDPGASYAPYRIYNIGNNQPVKLMDFVQAIENSLGIKATIEFKDMQPGDVESTFADVDDLVMDFDYKPQTPLQEGIDKFVEWYKEYYKV